MSALGEVESCRLKPALVAPSMVYVLLPTPPIDVPDASLGPVTKPCDMGGWSASGFTPGAKRANPTGMFENIGSALICCESKLAPDDTDVVSSTGAVPVTVTCSLILPTSSVNGRLVCCPTANATPSRVAVLKPAIST